jgi:hypothetical protein
MQHCCSMGTHRLGTLKSDRPQVYDLNTEQEVIGPCLHQLQHMKLTWTIRIHHLCSNQLRLAAQHGQKIFKQDYWQSRAPPLSTLELTKDPLAIRKGESAKKTPRFLGILLAPQIPSQEGRSSRPYHPSRTSD